MSGTEGKTERTLDGRLFPGERLGPFHLSAQGGIGYQSSPSADLPHLEDYRTVEVHLSADRPEPVDPHTLGLPPELAARFPRLDGGHPAIAGQFPVSELPALRTALLHAAANVPNAGIPRGRVSWPGRPLFHGASIESAEDIGANGIDMRKCTPGYFGVAFYCADAEGLAWSNYADFSDDEGAVVVLNVEPGARVLDLRNAEDFGAWQASGLQPHLGRPDFASRAVRAGIDAVYDRSFGGIAVYTAAAVSVVGVRYSRDQVGFAATR